MTTIRDDVIDLCRSVGLVVAGDQVFGPLDSIAELLDLILFPHEQECSEATKLYVLGRAIAELPSAD